ncbi:hypothetical protein FQN60_004826, partial [Etheostoma spectabile]
MQPVYSTYFSSHSGTQHYESAGPIQLRGEVGGSVTFSCPVAKQKLKFVYFQRGEIFVNGYYESKNTSQLAWKNTRVDHDKTTMHMYHLNVSHDGEYQCHFQYSDSGGAQKQVIHLSLTANYSKPDVTVHYSDENHRYSCLVTCASHCGYPSNKVMWNVSGIQMWKVLNSSEISDPETMMVNSSSTAYFNCSNGETSISCSVGDVSSDVVSVCSPRDPPPVSHSPVIIAIFATVGISIMLVLLLCWRCKKGQRGRQQSTMKAMKRQRPLEWQIVTVTGCQSTSLSCVYIGQQSSTRLVALQECNPKDSIVQTHPPSIPLSSYPLLPLLPISLSSLIPLLSNLNKPGKTFLCGGCGMKYTTSDLPHPKQDQDQLTCPLTPLLITTPHCIATVKPEDYSSLIPPMVSSPGDRCVTPFFPLYPPLSGAKGQ